jgi:hypothetical protein
LKAHVLDGEEHELRNQSLKALLALRMELCLKWSFGFPGEKGEVVFT